MERKRGVGAFVSCKRSLGGGCLEYAARQGMLESHFHQVVQ